MDDLSVTLFTKSFKKKKLNLREGQAERSLAESEDLVRFGPGRQEKPRADWWDLAGRSRPSVPVGRRRLVLSSVVWFLPGGCLARLALWRGVGFALSPRPPHPPSTFSSVNTQLYVAAGDRIHRASGNGRTGGPQDRLRLLRRPYQDPFQNQLIRMSILAPPTLLELAGKNLLKNESLAIAALEELPKELFPPLFLAAFNEKSRNTLKAMVHAWPFACLPLGALMKGQEIQKETFQAVLDGIDALLVQEICSRKCKLQVLDLRRNAHQDFWSVWSKAEYDAGQPPKKKQKVGDDTWLGMKQTVAPMEVLVDLCLKEDTFDEVLDCLLEKVKKKKGLLRLLCRKLKIFAMPLHDIKVILKMVQLESIQDVEVNCTWKLSTLGKFAPLVGHMFNLRRLLISHIHLLPCASPEQEEEWVGRFASQFLTLHHLQELYLDSISFLKGRLNQLLRCLSSPLETLSITNCLLTELDLEHMSLCTNLRKLKDLGLSSITLTKECVKSLGVLLEHTCVSLQDLDLDDCGITDPEFNIILPALSRCTQLTTFSFCGNRISMVVLEKLLEHTIGLSHLSHVLYPAPLESYEDEQGTLNLGKLVHLHAKLKQLLQKFGRPGMLWFSANPCPHCGDRTFYDPEPILCPCYRST